MDRVFRGALSGIVAGIVMNVWSFISYSVLHSANLRFIDWAAIIVYGSRPEGLFQDVFALFLHFIWVSFLGIGFTMLLPLTSPKGYLLKGIGYSWITGFFMYSITTMLRVPYLSTVPFNTVVTNFIGATIWGFVLAAVSKKLEAVQTVRYHTYSPVPVQKKVKRYRIKIRKPRV